jgi:hypothetical protein
VAEVKQQEAKAFTGLLDQKQVNYLPLSPEPGVKACANCRWFKAASWDNDPPECHLVRNYPEPILATGLSDRWESSIPPPTPDISNPLPVMIVPMEDLATEEMALPTTGKGLVETIVGVVSKNMFQSADSQVIPQRRCVRGHEGCRWQALLAGSAHWQV